MISIGDKVVAVKQPGHDALGRPAQRPCVGKIYVITGIYHAKYGAGCTLAGLNPAPYAGYFLHVDKPLRRGVERGWYFRKVEAADEAFTTMIKKIKVKEKNDA